MKRQPSGMYLIDTEIFKQIWESVDISWKNIFQKNKTSLIAAVKHLIEEEKECYPAPNLIFRAFNLCPLMINGKSNIKIVLVGLDPYSDGTACGLSFSVFPGNKINPSLRMIYGCLTNSGLIDSPGDGDLSFLAEQGILLLNMSLTFSKDQKKMINLWTTFISKVCYEISICNSNTAFILLGNEAQKLKKIINTQNVFEWSHPSPISTINNDIKNPKHFIHCDAFIKASKMYPEIIWDRTKYDLQLKNNKFMAENKYEIEMDKQKQLEIEKQNLIEIEKQKLIETEKQKMIEVEKQKMVEMEKQKLIEMEKQKMVEMEKQKMPGGDIIETNDLPELETYEEIKKLGFKTFILFTDGGCVGNGKSNSKASWAWCLVPFKTHLMLNKSVCVLDDLKTLEIDQIDKRYALEDSGCVLPYKNGNEIIYPSNNRGEFTAALDGLFYANSIGIKEILIVTDSELLIKTMTTYYPSWVKKNNFDGKKNLDLINKLDTAIKTFNRVSWIHIRSHKDNPKTNDIKELLWYYNDQCDKLCSQELENHK
jgi:uracil-DNA glycosylase